MPNPQGQVGMRGPLVYAGPDYTIFVQSPEFNPADSEIIYFGAAPKVPQTTEGQNRIFIRVAGVIRNVAVMTYARTLAGSNEAWSLYVRLNGATDYLVQTQSLNTNERLFVNDAMNIPIVVGDRLEMKFVNPIWVPNPTGVCISGYLYVLVG